MSEMTAKEIDEIVGRTVEQLRRARKNWLASNAKLMTFLRILNLRAFYFGEKSKAYAREGTSSFICPRVRNRLIGPPYRT